MKLAILLLFAFVAQANSALRVRFVNPDNTCGANNGLSIGTGYCDLKEAEAKEQTDLVTAGDSLHIWVMPGTGASGVWGSSSSTNISGFTVSETSSITVRALPGYEHDGVFQTTKCYSITGNNTGLTITDGWVEIDGLIITGSATTTNNAAGVSISNVDVNSFIFLKNNIIRTVAQGDDNEDYGIIDQTTNRHYSYVINNLIYFPTSTVGNLNQGGGDGFPIGTMLASNGTTMYWYHNTVSSGAYKGNDSTAGTFIAKANIVSNSLNNAYEATCASSSTDNTGDDATTCGSNMRHNKTITYLAPLQQNWHLAGNSVGVSSCAALSTDTAHNVTYDFEGSTRPPAGGFSTCGADEIGTNRGTVAAAGGGGGGGGGGSPPPAGPSQINFTDYIIQSKRDDSCECDSGIQ